MSLSHGKVWEQGQAEQQNPKRPRSDVAPRGSHEKEILAKQGAESQDYRFVTVREFQPNVDGWQTVGTIVRHEWVEKNKVLLSNAEDFAVQITFLSDCMLRVQFRPEKHPEYEKNTGSYAVTDPTGGTKAPPALKSRQILDNGSPTLEVTLGATRVLIGLQPYGVAVYRDGRLITEDTFGKNVIFSNEAVACLRNAPENENYFGFGEKAGVHLNKKGFTMTCFNYDNFTYEGSNVVPANNDPGPLNPSEPLYNSMPFMLAVGSSAASQSGDSIYSYGLFLDNVSQSYFNMGSNDYSDMSGKYYLGALYGDLDYYVMVGKGEGTAAIRDVLRQYSSLTGRPALPPKYALGYQQGCYGYYNEGILVSAAQAYRAHKIPIDGLHIDVDFQDNYRTFTSSPEKFPNPKAMFETLHGLGFKCSTNITGIITSNPLDEKGNTDTPYGARDQFVSVDKEGGVTIKPGAEPPFIYNTRAGRGEDPNLFIAKENYGDDDTSLYPNGFNPYPSPHPDGTSEHLGTSGFYCDLGQEWVRRWWGDQYAYLLDLGLDMIWQDMTCPAVVANKDNETPDKTLPLNLMMYDKVTEQYQPNAKVHNAFAINLIQATYEGLTRLKQKLNPSDYNYKKRNFIIARGGYAGVHRYAGIWTGDSASSWDFLKINIPEVLNIGLSGQPLSGCDIGGFANGTGSRGTEGITDYELFTRWMNLGAFLPWYRNHYDGYTKLFQEPYRYEEPVPSHCRKYIEERYRLIQLFYDGMYESTQSGIPLCRALFLNDAHDPNLTAHLDDQFFVGNDLLVAPVVNPGQTEREIYLPTGSSWYVYNENTGPLGDPTPGGTIQNWFVPLGLVPLYVREGAILPKRELEQYIGQLEVNPITFNIYPGRDSTYTLYQDDHVSVDNEEGVYRLTDVSHTGMPGGQRVILERRHDQYSPPEPYFYLAFLGTRAPSSVKVQGKSVPNLGTSDAQNASPTDAYYFNASLGTTYVKVFDTSASLELEVLW